MNYLSVSNVSRMGRENPLFKDVSFGLNEGDKAALIGKNGSGKSTLLQCIAGTLESESGSIVINKEAGVSYLPQNPLYDAKDTIEQHIFKSDSPKLHTIRQYEHALTEISKHARLHPGKDIPQSLQKECDSLMEIMNRSELWNYETDIKSILTTLGIFDLERKMGTLSGGMIKKVCLAQVLVEDTKLLLLDEPTNHLDISTIFFLQEYLRTTNRSVLMVTHDRYFLDAVCNNIYELDRERVKLYVGNYSQYLEKKEIEAEIEKNTDRRIESVLRTEREWLLRGPCARTGKSRSRIDKVHSMINRDKFKEDKGFSFEVAGRRMGGKVLELHSISKSYPKGGVKDGEASPVLDSFSYTFTKGEKIGVFGDNGTGKTTLLNIVTGRLAPDKGTIVKGENTVFAYYEQNPVFENTESTVLEYLKETAELITLNNGKTLTASLMLEEFGFEGRIQHSAVSTLSGGERKRLFLVRLLMTNPNFLILDEPTNDFDIFTMSVLESFLQSFSGCLLVVSHDRYFMDKVADTLFILEDDGSVSGFVGKCSDYILLRNELKAAEEAEKKAEREKERCIKAEESKTSLPVQSEKKKLSFKEQKEFENLETDIAILEDRITELDALLAGGETDHVKLAQYGSEYENISKALEEKYLRWEELAERI